MSTVTCAPVCTAIIGCMFMDFAKKVSHFDPSTVEFPWVLTWMLGKMIWHASNAEEEGYWQTIERTIDVAVTRTNMAAAGGL